MRHSSYAENLTLPASARGTDTMVAAVIVTHANIGLASKCVASLPRTLQRDQLIVVVNAPALADPQLMHDLGNKAIIVANEAPVGYGANLNKGVERLHHKPRYVLLLNDDVILEAGALDALVEAISAPAVGVAGANIVSPEGDPQVARFAFPSVRSEVAVALAFPDRIAQSLKAQFASAARPHETAECDWVLGAAMLLRMEAFTQAGGMDESYFLYSEEVDLCYRLARSGWKTVSCGPATVQHVGGSSTSDLDTESMLGSSRALFIHRHWARWRRLLLTLVLSGVYVWNAAYILGRVVISPRSAKANLQVWRQCWGARSFLRRTQHDRQRGS
jgi:N-acetylglucosaminyl-diphospho-decaprenol L-rhamnosyltransferase